jgi:predicted TIM-barrel fold metal-dependent hydrolase
MSACRVRLVVHTDFQIRGHADLQQSHPLLLHNLLVDSRYKDLTFVLLHGGNPDVGERTYLAKLFPNVVIDFPWISWVTRARFRQARREWLEVVPHDRLCWGSDSSTPETIVGIGRCMRAEIAGVLLEMLREGMLDERAAEDFLEHCFQKTPARIFGLALRN